MKNNVHTVFLADDNEEDTLMFQQIINDLCPSVKLEIVKSGKELLKLLSNGPLPNLIILDINMTPITGMETLQEIRNNSRYDALPVMIYSTTDNKEDINRCIKHGADYYATKSTS